MESFRRSPSGERDDERDDRGKRRDDTDHGAGDVARAVAALLALRLNASDCRRDVAQPLAHYGEVLVELGETALQRPRVAIMATSGAFESCYSLVEST